MRLRPIVRGVATVLLLVGALGDQALHAGWGGFGNADVLTMLKEGRSDSAIIARIAEVQNATYKLAPEDLQALKDAGASLSVLSAMLARARQSSGKSFGSDIMPAFKGLRAETVTLVTGQGRQELELARGERNIVNPYARVTEMYLEYTGLHAGVRTTDRKPSLLVRSDSDPSKRYYLGKLLPGTKDKRELFIENSLVGYRPVKKLRIASTVAEENKGIWRVTPEENLEPGEYGLMDGARLFAFGVDAQEQAADSAHGGA